MCAWQWLNGKYEGFGVEFFKNDSYHGEYRGGARQGWGTATFENGDAYEGQWAAGARHGIGMHLSADGSTYIGGFLCAAFLLLTIACSWRAILQCSVDLEEIEEHKDEQC